MNAWFTEQVAREWVEDRHRAAAQFRQLPRAARPQPLAALRLLGGRALRVTRLALPRRLRAVRAVGCSV